MTDSITPPEGQLSFSGIPSAEFVEDVDAHMAGEESAESQLKVVTSLMLDMTIIEKIGYLMPVYNKSSCRLCKFLLLIGVRRKTSKIQIYGDKFDKSETKTERTNTRYQKFSHNDRTSSSQIRIER